MNWQELADKVKEVTEKTPNEDVQAVLVSDKERIPFDVVDVKTIDSSAVVVIDDTVYHRG